MRLITQVLAMKPIIIFMKGVLICQSLLCLWIHIAQFVIRQIMALRYPLVLISAIFNHIIFICWSTLVKGSFDLLHDQVNINAQVRVKATMT